MAGERDSSLACRIHIGLESVFDFFTKVDNHFVPAFPRHFDSVIFEIDVLYIESDTFGYTDACPEKKGQDSKIAVLCLFIIYFALAGKIVSAVVYIIEKLGHFIGIETDDGLIVQFRHIDE